jgi:glutamate transport system permease protein
MSAVFDNFNLFVHGFATTLTLTLLSGVFALVLGTVLAAMRVSPVPTLRATGTAYVAVFRNVPTTVILFFVAFVLPQLGVRFSFYVFALIGLTVYYGAFFCEALRSGINAVPVGQSEAARSLGLTFRQVLLTVVLPQAMRTVVPPLINTFIALTRSSAVAGAFGVAELFATMARLVNIRGDAVIAILVATGLFYLAITIPAGLIAGHLERKVTFSR